MVDWDRNSPQLEANLDAILRQARDAFRARRLPDLALMLDWHSTMMHGLDVENPNFVGAFRGMTQTNFDVHVAGHLGTPFAQVGKALQEFETKLQKAVAVLDNLIPPSQIPDDPAQRQVIELCAWAHSEWVRIHPFINGNGRTARLWANAIALRYSMPPFLTMRPRPGDPYAKCAALAMQGGSWHDVVPMFWDMYEDRLNPA